MSVPSFAADIAPILYPYRGQMMWRLDLASYDDVTANAEVVYAQISQQLMPPPPFAPFPADFVALFEQWMNLDPPPK